MGYVIAAILVVLLIGGFVLFLVTNATRKSSASDADDPNALGILGSDDESPAGSTDQHASGETPNRFAREDRPHAAPPVDGGEAEARRSTR